MIEGGHKKFSVYKGLQRPIQFKGLKGGFIYAAFILALGSLFIGIIVSTFTTFLAGSTAMVAVAFGGIIGMALYQRKFGLYRKNVTKGVFIMHSMYNRF
jgi:hypothetical protein